MTSDKNLVPKDYEEMYHLYFAPGKLAPMLCQRLSYGKDVEDRVQEAYLRLLSTDILAKFDGSKSNFGGMIFIACRSACCNAGRTNNRDAKNLSLVEDTDEPISGVVDLGRLMPDNGVEARLNAMILVRELRDKAKKAKDRGKAKRFQYQEKLIELLLTGYNNEEIAEALDVSRASIDLWLKELASGV